MAPGVPLNRPRLRPLYAAKRHLISYRRPPRLGRRTKLMVPAPCAQSLSPAADLLATTCAKDPCKLSVQLCKNCVTPHQLALGGPQTSVNFRKRTTQPAARAVPPARLRWRQAATPLLPLYVGCLHLRLRLWLYACCCALQRRTYSYRRPLGRYWAVARRAGTKAARGLRRCSGLCLCLCSCLCLI